LSRIPGASRWFSGSAVVYRNETKSAWLHVDPDQLADPRVGPVSRLTAQSMCAGVLDLTPEADLAASITGHLGPDAPPELDGLVYVGVQRRAPGNEFISADVRPLRLASTLPADSPFDSLRLHRQHEAAVNVLLRLFEALCHALPGESEPDS
ncbi:MAG: CinA family protein, partial [Planctomycetaceae bacterium]|nr:CinA family protein [Planctomycetaceae bacterium]